MKQETKSKLLITLFSVLFFGAVWGIFEATVGTILHFPFLSKAGMFAASSTIMVPIGYFLMANCYKKTGTFYSVYLMGVVAALIKLSVAIVLGFRQSVYSPAIYIVVESLLMGTALAVFNPKKVLSLRTLGAVIVTNTLYQFSYLMINMAMGGANIFASEKAWVEVGEYSLFKVNCVAILYSFAGGAILYGLAKLAESKNWNLKVDFNKLIYSPITASIAIALAFGLTISMALI